MYILINTKVIKSDDKNVLLQSTHLRIDESQFNIFTKQINNNENLPLLPLLTHNRMDKPDKNVSILF
jgi:hypothetical protein